MRPLHLAVVILGVWAGCAGSESPEPSPSPSPSGPSSGANADSPGGDSQQADLASAPKDAGAPKDASAPKDAGGTTPSPDLSPPPPPTKKVLSFTWQGEELYYYCGPSAARMALSVHQANPPSQQTLGGYMGTTSNGTDSISLVKGALDHYLNINSYNETDLPNDPPTQGQQDALKKDLVASIDAGYALVANVVSGWRPPFYPQSGTIYHYIALVGYDKSGDLVLVADPAATGCGDGYCGSPSSSFYNVPKSYWINTSDLGVWITPKGYTWHP
jgi:hypothetical protein